MKKINILSIFLLCSAIQIFCSDSDFHIIDNKERTERINRKIRAIEQQINNGPNQEENVYYRRKIARINRREQQTERFRASEAQLIRAEQEKFEDILQKHPDNIGIQHCKITGPIYCIATMASLLSVVAAGISSSDQAEPINTRVTAGLTGMVASILSIVAGTYWARMEVARFEEYKRTRQSIR